MTGSIGREFMEKTQFRYLQISDQQKGLPQPPLELGVPDGATETINLPSLACFTLGDIPLKKAIEARSSLRRYSGEPLSLKELSYLLWCTQGIKRVVPGRTTLRTVPSAGARHPFETYLLINQVKGVEPGLYRFLASEHRLVKLDVGPQIDARICKACLDQEFIQESAVTFIWVAVTHRTTWRYGERGYRYLHLDAGHVCQNLYLASESIQAGACAIGAFSDEEMNRLLELDGVEQFVIYLAAVGKRK
jgi:SagB-type dehydrogenase family enzyme